MKKLLLFSLALVLCGYTIKAQSFNNFNDSIQHLRSMKMNKIHANDNQGFFLKGPSDLAYLMDSSLDYKWNAAGSIWSTTAYEKAEYAYDNYGRNITHRDYRWRSTTNEWINTYEYHFIYNQNGDIKEWISNRYDTISNVWVPEEHDTLFYDNSKNLIRETWNLYNKTDDSWHINVLLVWDYNATGGLTEQYTKYWDDITYELSWGSRSTFVLNSMNMPTETIQQSLDVPTNTWTDENQVFSEYTNNTILAKETINMWTGSEWVLSRQNIYTYTGGLLMEELSQIWDDGSLAWMDFQKTTYTYDAAQHKTSQLTQSWYISSWVNSSLYSYIYNNNDQLIDYSFKYYNIQTGLVTYGYNYTLSFDANNLNYQSIYRTWSIPVNNWLNAYLTKNFFSLHPSLGLNAPGAGNISVYPNPATNVMRISGILPNISIVVCDLTGKVLISRPAGQATETIDIRSLSKGIYLLKVYDKILVKTIKFVKR